MANYLLQPDPDGNCCDCPSRASPCDSCSNVLYIQFQIRSNDSNTASQSFQIGTSDEHYNLEVNRSDGVGGSNLFLEYFTLSGSHIINAAPGSFALNTWYTIDIKLDFSASPASATFRIDSSVIGSFLLDKGGLTIDYFGLGNVDATGFKRDENYDNLKLGTTSYGSSDLFDADFSSAIVPPFDSVVDPSGALSISAGTLKNFHAAGSSVKSYANKSFVFP